MDQSYRIVADSTQAEAANKRINDGLRAIQAQGSSMSSTFDSIRQSIERSMNSAGNALETVGRIILRTAEAAAALAFAFKSVGLTLAAIGPQAAQASASLETLYRVGRVGYAAVTGTLAETLPVVGAGILLQQSLQSAYRQGGILNNQAFLTAGSSSIGVTSPGSRLLGYQGPLGASFASSATQTVTPGLSFQDIQQLQLAASFRGTSASLFTNAAGDLQKSISSGGASGSLAALGIDPSNKSYADNIRAIGAAFDSITDPVQKARMALALFPTTAAQVLPQLNGSLSDSIKTIQTWGLAIGDDRAREITTFKQNVDELKRSLNGLGDTFSAIGTKASNWFAGAGASIGNALFAGGDISRNQSGMAYLSKFTDAEKNEAFQAGIDPADLRSIRAGIAGPLGATTSRDVAASLRSSAWSAMDNYGATRDGSTAGLGAAMARRQAAAQVLAYNRSGAGTGTLTPDQVAAASQQYISASQDIARYQNLQLGYGTSDFMRGQSQSSTYAYQDAYASGIGGVAGQFLSLQNQLQRSMHRTVDINGNPVDVTTPLTGTQVANNQAMRMLLYRQQFSSGPSWSDENSLSLSRFQSGLDLSSQANGIVTSTADLNSQSALGRIGFQRDYALRGITGDDQDSIDAQLAIQRQYLLQSSTVQAADLERKKRQDLINAGILTYDPVSGGVVAASNLTPGQTSLQNAIVGSYGAQGAGVNQSYTQGVLSAEQDAALKSADLVKKQNEDLFNDLKSSASSVLDALFSKSSNIFQQIGQILKKSILDALSGVLANNFAASITNAIHPGAVTMQSGGFLGALGISNQPSFSSGALAALGGVASGVTTSGDPSVVAARGQGLASVGDWGAAGPAAALVAGFGGGDSGLPTGFPGFAGGFPLTGYGIGAGPGGIDPSAADAQAAIGGDSAVAAARTSALGASASGVPGATGGSKSGNPFSGITSLVKSFASTGGSIQIAPGIATTSAGIAQSLGGGVLGAIAGGAASFVASPAATTLGASIGLQGLFAKRQTVGSSAATVGGFGLAGASLGAQGVLGLGLTGGAVVGVGAGFLADGLRRGGVTGELEDIGGGAAIGFEFGGPIGAAVGAAVGAVAGGIRSLITTDVDHARNLAKSLYHISISTQMAQQIVEIAKQNYSGSISVAIRSKPVLDLLGLYAQATGQPWGVKNQPYPYFLQQGTNGIQQNATYVDGQAYSFAGPLGVAGGVQTTVLNPTYNVQTGSLVKGSGSNTPGGTYYQTGGGDSQQTSISVQLDGPATTALFSGQIASAAANQPRMYANSVQNAYQNSSPLSASVGFLSPTLLTM